MQDDEILQRQPANPGAVESPQGFRIGQRNVRVKWVIDGGELTRCNHPVIVPPLGLEFDMVESAQVVDFMPPQAVTFAWSWWMGMSPGMFVVEENVASSASAAHASPTEETQPSR